MEGSARRRFGTNSRADRTDPSRRGKGKVIALALGLVLLARELPGRLSWVEPLWAQDSVEGRVIAVYDGDTIKVRLESGEETRVRLIGVDAAEFDDERDRVRILAFLAKRFAYLNLHDKDVRLTFGPELRDAYGRLLAFIWPEDGKTFNETLIREGFAFAYFRFPFDAALAREFEEAETEARRAGCGLWRRDPWPLIGPEDAARWEGQVVTVRFLCVDSSERGHYRILSSSGGAGFQAVVPSADPDLFPESLAFENRWVQVTGLVERYRGVPQIMVGLPVQIEIMEN